MWSAATDFSMNCSQGCADKIVSGKAVLLPLSQEDFPFKFSSQERMDPKAAKKQLSGRLNELKSKTLTEDYEARKAVLSSFSVFLGLDLMISVEDDANQNEFLRAIAMWAMPGFLTLVKSCVWIRKQLRREALSSEARNKPFVMELIEAEVFIDTIFSPTTVDKIKGLCGLSQSFSAIITPGKSLSHKASQGSS